MFKTLFKKSEQPLESYDASTQKPIIRASICTGEQVAGFKDLATGQFSEIMLIKNNDDLLQFMQKYGISKEDISKEY